MTSRSMGLKILIVTPAAARTRSGNLATARRWRRLLNQLGHHTQISGEFLDQGCDLLVALHAHHSAASALRWRRCRADAPLIVGISGTDLYRDLQRSRGGQKAVATADRIVVLQPDGIRWLPEHCRERCRVVFQSVQPRNRTTNRIQRWWQVAVVGHLRAVKDPLRTAYAVRDLPGNSRIRVVHLGEALTPGLRSAAEAETRANRRYQWRGSRRYGDVLETLAGSQLMVLSSRMEGGANVVGESISVQTPVVASRISGTIGLLGEDYPGFYDVGDTSGLQRMLLAAEGDREFYQSLMAACAERRWQFEPECERLAWKSLLAELELG
ncbi:MAG: selenoneine biosynthesis selenosugar synthase SenB [Planctomycetaceae bacterium]|nr:selenoneine biosynthesis selenosugar synthase SenB [Planctomycetaceae bacterium]